MKKLEKLIQIDGRLDEISDDTKLSKEELDKKKDKICERIKLSLESIVELLK